MVPFLSSADDDAISNFPPHLMNIINSKNKSF
jgi:hypothetical protein